MTAQNFELYLGCNALWEIALALDGEAFLPGEFYDLTLTVKRHRKDADSAALFQLMTGAGLEVTGSTAEADIVPESTADLTPCDGYWDIAAVHVTTGERHIVAEGRAELKRSIGRENEPSVPIYTRLPVIARIPVVSLTQAAYDALTTEQREDESVIYDITDFSY